MSNDTKDAKKEDVERVVHEVRRTTLIPKVSTERFVFEKHDDMWRVHFAAATNYSLEQMKEIVEVMGAMDVYGRLSVTHELIDED